MSISAQSRCSSTSLPLVWRDVLATHQLGELEQSFFREPARERHEFMHLLWSAGAQGFARPAPLWLACFFADLNRLGCYFADERVVAAVEPQLYAAEGIRAKRKQPESLDAWECVMRALSCVNSRSQNDYAMARELLERAIELDPAYAQA